MARTLATRATAFLQAVPTRTCHFFTMIALTLVVAHRRIVTDVQVNEAAVCRLCAVTERRELFCIAAVDDCLHRRADFAAEGVGIDSAEVRFDGFTDGSFVGYLRASNV